MARTQRHRGRMVAEWQASCISGRQHAVENDGVSALLVCCVVGACRRRKLGPSKVKSELLPAPIIVEAAMRALNSILFGFGAVCVVLTVGVQSGSAQTVTPFQMVGHIQALALDNQTDTFSSAKLTVNGIQLTVPKHLVVQMPAAYLTMQQIFANAQGVSKARNESGLALEDQVPPLAAFEVAVAGNIVDGEYRAGLISISQQSLNISDGYIRSIDTSTGMMCVGGAKTASPVSPLCAPGDVRIRLNDPALESPDPFAGDGRYGRPNPAAPVPTSGEGNSRYPDPRFAVDQSSPSVHALTGFPMCVPRNTNDPECPEKNRPPEPTFVMDSVDLLPPARFGTLPIKACPLCDPTKQAPVRVGDHVAFSGTLAADAGGRYLSIHTLTVDVGIYTKPGQDPAYLTLEESLLGTMGPAIVCATTAECQDRIKVEGFTTDPTRIDLVHLYALDVARGGEPKARLLLPPSKDQAVYGRFRYISNKNAGILFDSNGTVKGATRELMVHLDGLTPLPSASDVPESPKVAHGLVAGTYIAPIGEYIFPEPTGVQGGALPPLNFECLAFLVNGWGISDAGIPSIPALSPWPGTPSPPTLACR